MAGRVLLAALLAAFAICTRAIKLKFAEQECMTYTFNQYEYFYGSFVATADAYGHIAHYNLVVTSPTGHKLYELYGETSATFHLVPVESGSHRFCLTLSKEHLGGRHIAPREVLWNINVGYAEGHDKIEESDTQYLWHHIYQIDGQVQELKSRLHYLYWRERRHRETVESTHRRALFYAMLRNAVLVLMAIGNVLIIKHMFDKRK